MLSTAPSWGSTACYLQTLQGQWVRKGHRKFLLPHFPLVRLPLTYQVQTSQMSYIPHWLRNGLAGNHKVWLAVVYVVSILVEATEQHYNTIRPTYSIWAKRIPISLWIYMKVLILGITLVLGFNTIHPIVPVWAQRTFISCKYQKLLLPTNMLHVCNYTAHHHVDIYLKILNTQPWGRECSMHVSIP